MTNAAQQLKGASDCENEDQMQTQEPAFLREFKAALGQQPFGICQFRIIECKGTVVKANLTLSDGRTCTVELSNQGYEVLSLMTPTEEQNCLESADISQFTVFESLDSLLRAVSPLFNATWERSLLERLDVIAKSS